MIDTPAPTVPLWCQDSGFDAGGIDMIAQRCRVWHERGRKRRQIKHGDRVAVLGHGIAVVEYADDDLVQAVLGGSNVLSIERQDILWDRHNRRWETTPGASMILTVRRNQEHRTGIVIAT